MIGAIIITHASLSIGLKEAVEMIAGKQEDFVTISLREGDGVMDLVQRIADEKVKLNSEGLMLFVDMFGATPCNAACIHCAQSDDTVIAGVNLPLLLEFVTQRRHAKKEELLQKMQECSKVDFKMMCQKDIIGEEKNNGS